MKDIQYSRRLQKLADKKDFDAIRKIAVYGCSQSELRDEYDGVGFDANEAFEDRRAAFERGFRAAAMAAKKNKVLFAIEELDDGENIAYIAAKNLADAIAKVKKLPNRE